MDSEPREQRPSLSISVSAVRLHKRAQIGLELVPLGSLTFPAATVLCLKYILQSNLGFHDPDASEADVPSDARAVSELCSTSGREALGCTASSPCLNPSPRSVELESVPDGVALVLCDGDEFPSLLRRFGSCTPSPSEPALTPACSAGGAFPVVTVLGALFPASPSSPHSIPISPRVSNRAPTTGCKSSFADRASDPSIEIWTRKRPGGQIEMLSPAWRARTGLEGVAPERVRGAKTTKMLDWPGVSGASVMQTQRHTHGSSDGTASPTALTRLLEAPRDSPPALLDSAGLQSTNVVPLWAV